jgi:hypothetical protein
MKNIAYFFILFLLGCDHNIGNKPEVVTCIENFPLSLCIDPSFPYLPLALNQPFVRGDLLQAHGAARMNFLRADAYFRPQAELRSIGESRRCIGIYAGGVHQSGKKPCMLSTLRDDTLTVP